MVQGLELAQVLAQDLVLVRAQVQVQVPVHQVLVVQAQKLAHQQDHMLDQELVRGQALVVEAQKLPHRQDHQPDQELLQDQEAVEEEDLAEGLVQAMVKVMARVQETEVAMVKEVDLGQVMVKAMENEFMSNAYILKKEIKWQSSCTLDSCTLF